MATIWSLVNISDPYTFEGDDFEAASIACCILGNGKYSLKEIGGDRECPIFLLGGHNEWFKDNFGKTFEESMRSKIKEVSELLDTILAGSPSDRLAFNNSGLSWEQWHDRKLTSSNDIGRRAKSLSATIFNAIT